MKGQIYPEVEFLLLPRKLDDGKWYWLEWAGFQRVKNEIMDTPLTCDDIFLGSRTVERKQYFGIRHIKTKDKKMF